jgi:hypothetical protein
MRTIQVLGLLVTGILFIGTEAQAEETKPICEGTPGWAARQPEDLSIKIYLKDDLRIPPLPGNGSKITGGPFCVFKIRTGATYPRVVKRGRYLPVRSIGFVEGTRWIGIQTDDPTIESVACYVDNRETFGDFKNRLLQAGIGSDIGSWAACRNPVLAGVSVEDRSTKQANNLEKRVASEQTVSRETSHSLPSPSAGAF